MLTMALLVAMLAVFALAWMVLGREPASEARFAREADIRRAGLRSRKGILLGRLHGRLLRAPAPATALVVAPPRSGKGVGFVIPNLLDWPGSAIVTDIKLENWRATSGFRHRHGQEVIVFAPLAAGGETQRYNPLDFVTGSGAHRLDDLQRICFKLISTPPQGDPMWAAEARSLLEALLLWLLDVEGQACLGAALRLVREACDFSGWVQAGLLAQGSRLDSACRHAFNGFLQKAPKEQSGVLSTLKAALSPWSNPLIDAATACSDFDPRALRRRPMTIYLGVAPADLARLAPLLNIFLQQTFDALLRHLPGPDEPVPVLALLDEFAALGRLETVERGVGYFAGYQISAVPILQDLAQLSAVYGVHAAEVFLAAARYRLAFTPNSEGTAGYLSRQLGVRMLKHPPQRGRRQSELRTRRELMMPHEVLRLDRRRAIILVEAALPILARKITYYRERHFQRRLLPPRRIRSETRSALGGPGVAPAVDIHGLARESGAGTVAGGAARVERADAAVAARLIHRITLGIGGIVDIVQRLGRRIVRRQVRQIGGLQRRQTQQGRDGDPADERSEERAAGRS